MAFCGNCGAQHGETENFCGVCGYPTGKAAAPVYQQPVQPVYQQQPIYQPQTPPKKKSKKPLIIGGATGVVAIVLVVAIIFTNGFGLLGGGGGGNVNPSDPTGGNSTTISANPNVDPGGTNPKNPDAYDVDDSFWLNYDWDNFDIYDMVETLGDAAFTVDSANKATGEFTPGIPLSLSVTDSEGVTWTLDVPAGALLTGETITMTALRDITTDGLFDTLDGGVLLEPDGLYFYSPATLTVSGDDCVDAIMLVGNHDGGNLDLSCYENGAGSATVYITHFSTVTSGHIYGYNPDGYKTASATLGSDGKWHWGWRWNAKGIEPGVRYIIFDKDGNVMGTMDIDGNFIPDPNYDGDGLDLPPNPWDDFPQELRDLLEDVIDLSKLTRLQRAALELLKKPVKLPDVDPPSVWFDDCPDKTDISKFIKAFGNPEKPIIDKLWKELTKFSRSFLRKNPTPDSVNLDNAMKELQELGANVALATALCNRLAEKANKLIDKYKYMPDKFYAVASAASFPITLFGFSKVNQTEIDKWWRETWNYHMHRLVDNHDYHRMHVFNQITLAGAFAGAKVPDNYQTKISNALTFRVEWELEEHVYFTICSKGEAIVSMDANGFFGEAAGDGRLTSFSDPDGAVYVTAFPSFGNKVQLSSFSPCTNEVVFVYIDKCGTDFTAYADTDNGPMPIPFTDYPKPIIHYVDGRYDKGFFMFVLDLENLNEKCAEGSFTAQQEELSHTLDFKIFHQPKDDVFMK